RRRQCGPSRWNVSDPADPRNLRSPEIFRERAGPRGFCAVGLRCGGLKAGLFRKASTLRLLQLQQSSCQVSKQKAHNGSLKSAGDAKRARNTKQLGVFCFEKRGNGKKKESKGPGYLSPTPVNSSGGEGEGEGEGKKGAGDRGGAGSGGTSAF
ncbi:MAG: hypothetical protein BJ554DRAFT_6556, partial [Olpidium bornovanus]